MKKIQRAVINTAVISVIGASLITPFNMSVNQVRAAQGVRGVSADDYNATQRELKNVTDDRTPKTDD
ncbi:hypothetical protein BMT55_16520 [Listeria newyorkensis]|uniref:Uncharacterized protein n=1 Tax=Listeria newyorkensis TaxID=1497681 RepID=A0ABX4XNU0_9LIST|nr:MULTISPECIES: hypothetical protein [Listeria]KGL37362.1 hypothetical protein EP56_17835 [Listeriaceae bacterium FSL A5-0209]KGL37838.1 hypothetical protein EP58_16545 [Listeria newyorkensis]PNP87065.1 hypothetical protein BMT55_16520 [Listeria newyorkensis]RQW66037.1 hypothetical protein DUK53_13340 [Listeria sp. SHR_NRA_18]WAO20449.1 hypothetical protein OTR81_09020 [Listeria newyorkensis]